MKSQKLEPKHDTNIILQQAGPNLLEIVTFNAFSPVEASDVFVIQSVSGGGSTFDYLAFYSTSFQLIFLRGRTHVRIKGQNLIFYLESYATTYNIYFIRQRTLPRFLVHYTGVWITLT